MKSRLTIALVCACLLCACGHKTIPGVVSWSNAAQYAGDVATVEGPVVDVYHARSSTGSPTFIDVGGGYHSHHFTVLIWGEDLGAWSTSPESLYDGRTIDVHGKVQMYNGNAEVVATSPSQIVVK